MTDTFLNSPVYQAHTRMSANLMELHHNYRVALTGPHRTGKTTMAQAYSDKTGIPFFRSDVAQLMKACGFDSSKSYASNFKQRLTVQRKLLDKLDLQWDRLNGGFITDRSPLCFAMYTLCDVTGATETSGDDHRELTRYVDDCKAATLKHFNTVAVVPPSSTVPVDTTEGKAAASRAYLHNLFTTIRYLMLTLDKSEDMTDVVSLHQRVTGFRGELERQALVEVVQGSLRWQGREVVELFNVFSDEACEPTLLATVPPAAVTPAERATWLADVNQRQAFRWLQTGLSAALENEYMLDSDFLGC